MWDPKLYNIFFGRIIWLLLTAFLAQDGQYVEWNM